MNYQLVRLWNRKETLNPNIRKRKETHIYCYTASNLTYNNASQLEGAQCFWMFQNMFNKFLVHSSDAAKFCFQTYYKMV